MSDGTDGQNSSTTTTRLPDIRAEVREDGTGEISVDGVIERVRMANLAEAGAAITSRIAELAGTVGRPVPVQVRDPDGVWSLLIHPDGLVDEAPGSPADEPGETPDTTSGSSADASSGDGAPEVDAARATSPDEDRSGPGSAPTAAATAAASGRSGADRSPDPVSSTPSGGTPATPPSGVDSATSAKAPEHPPTTTSSATRGPAATLGSGARPQDSSATDAPPVAAAELTGAPLAAPTQGSAQQLPTLDDLLAARHPAASGGPAEHGWQAGVRRLTFGGISPKPGRVERRRRIASASVRRTLDGPKTIVIINPKGGAHKTTATMLLAATFGLQRGGYTLAWDNNETRGTLGWRSSHADHTKTAVDLLNALPALGTSGTVRIGDLDRTWCSEVNERASTEEAEAEFSSDASTSNCSLGCVRTNPSRSPIRTVPEVPSAGSALSRSTAVLVWSACDDRHPSVPRVSLLSQARV